MRVFTDEVLGSITLIRFAFYDTVRFFEGWTLSSSMPNQKLLKLEFVTWTIGTVYLADNDLAVMDS